MPITSSDNFTSIAPQQQPTVESQAYYFKCYTPLALFLGAADPALLLQRIHYWLQNTKAGYRLKDGSKWIFNGYREWQEQMPWLSVPQIGRIVRELEAVGWIFTERFYSLKDSVGFAQRTPGWQEDNQRKWYQVNYVKIYEDTGFDLLFDSADQSAPTQEKAETIENSQCSKLNNATFKFEHSSIYQKNTKPLSRESEKKGIEFDKEATEDAQTELSPQLQEFEGWMENNNDPDKDQSDAAPRNKTSKIVTIKHAPMFTPERPHPYPAGPWLTETGRLNEDFIRDRASLWRTGDTPASQAFGRMPVEEVMALVCCYYQKPDKQQVLEIHWASYVAKTQRYLSNVRQRLDAGIKIPLPEQQRVMAKLPAALSTPVESVYEAATIDLSLLPSSNVLPALPTSLQAPDDGENSQAYQNNVNPSDADWWIQKYQSALPKKKPKPTTDEW